MDSFITLILYPKITRTSNKLSTAENKAKRKEVKNMELKEFIETTLINIQEGIRGANYKLAENEGKKLGENASAMFVIYPKKEGNISFDIAVTISSETTENGEGGIKIAIANLGGKIGSTENKEHVSRIKFDVFTHQNVS